MKPIHKILFWLVAASTWLIAGSVTIPNTFTANTTAKASEVNDNFSAVKTAVDGNAGDIATNEDNITANASSIVANTNNIAANTSNITTDASNITINTNNIAANASSITGVISGVSTGGGLAGGGTSGDITIKRASGSVSITAAAFRPENNNCSMTYTAKWGYFNATSSDDDCKAYAQVSLPDGANIDEIDCYVYNNDTASPSIDLYLMANNKTSNETYYFFEMRSSGTQDNIQTLGDNTASPSGLAEVKNHLHGYLLYYNPGHTSSADDDRKLRGCTIYYSFQ